MNYTLHKSKDIIGNDYVFHPNKTIEELKNICDNMHDAIGFNSLGIETNAIKFSGIFKPRIR